MILTHFSIKFDAMIDDLASSHTNLNTNISLYISTIIAAKIQPSIPNLISFFNRVIKLFAQNGICNGFKCDIVSYVSIN